MFNLILSIIQSCSVLSVLAQKAHLLTLLCNYIACVTFKDTFSFSDTQNKSPRALEYMPDLLRKRRQSKRKTEIKKEEIKSDKKHT